MSLAAEAAYFDGNHCQHLAARDEHMRLERISTRARQPDARLWSIITKPVSEETEADREYLAAIERGEQENGNG